MVQVSARLAFISKLDGKLPWFSMAAVTGHEARGVEQAAVGASQQGAASTEAAAPASVAASTTVPPSDPVPVSVPVSESSPGPELLGVPVSRLSSVLPPSSGPVRS